MTTEILEMTADGPPEDTDDAAGQLAADERIAAVDRGQRTSASVIPAPTATVRAVRRRPARSSAGEFLTILGPSGCGKSTLAAAWSPICCRPLTGAIAVLGDTPARGARGGARSASSSRIRRCCRGAPSCENVALPLRGRHGPASARPVDARPDDAVSQLVGLAGLARRAIRTSCPAASASASPSPARCCRSRSILLMDEPFGALDEITRDRLNDELLRPLAPRPARPSCSSPTASSRRSISAERVLVLAANPGRRAGAGRPCARCKAATAGPVARERRLSGGRMARLRAVAAAGELEHDGPRPCPDARHRAAGPRRAVARCSPGSCCVPALGVPAYHRADAARGPAQALARMALPALANPLPTRGRERARLPPRQRRGDRSGDRSSSTAAPSRRAYFPVVLFFNTIPVLALAPIIILIFGLGILPKIIIAAIICFFPTLVNMVRGLDPGDCRTSSS